MPITTILGWGRPTCQQLTTALSLTVTAIRMKEAGDIEIDVDTATALTAAQRLLLAQEFWPAMVDQGYRANSPYRLVTSSVSVASADRIIGVNTSAARTITLPSTECYAGRVVIIKDATGSAGTNNITVATQGSETIDGAAGDDTITANWGVRAYFTDGANWFKA